MPDKVDHRRRGSRYRARKRAVSLLFEAGIRDVDVVPLAEERRAMGEASPEAHEVAPYTMEIVTGVVDHAERIDSTIGEHLREWTLDRLPGVDRAVLRAATWELLFGGEDLDPATVIDQAVLLTSDLSAEKSVPYVNAVLDGIAGLADHIRAAERAVSALESAAGETAHAGGPDEAGDGRETPTDVADATVAREDPPPAG